jgi:hypothetical protein
MYNGEKFKNLVLYVCSKCEDPRRLGATKLNKIIWYSERQAFLKLQKPISGVKFVKRQFGPVPIAIMPVLTQLQNEGALAIRDVEYFGKPKREFISLRNPELGEFSAQEISIIDQVTQIICEAHTAASISERTHDDIWEMAEIGEEIPLTTVFAVKGEVTESDVSWADAQIAHLSSAS